MDAVIPPSKHASHDPVDAVLSCPLPLITSRKCRMGQSLRMYGVQVEVYSVALATYLLRPVAFAPRNQNALRVNGRGAAKGVWT